MNRFLLFCVLAVLQIWIPESFGYSQGRKPEAEAVGSGELESDEGGPQGRTSEWQARRRRKLRNLVEPRTNVVERLMVQMEERGAQSFVLRWKDLYPKFGTISTGSGFGPGVRYFRKDLGGSKMNIESSFAWTFSDYRQADFQLGRFNKLAPFTLLGPADLGSPFEFGVEPAKPRMFLYLDLRYRYFPRERFYGPGEDSSEESRGDFLLEDGSAEIVGGALVTDWLGAAFRFGYSKVNVARGSDEGVPDVHDLFGPETLPGLVEQPDFLHWDSAVVLDSRDESGNPHRGAVLGLSVSGYDDRGPTRYGFHRYSLDSRCYVPLGSRQRVIAARFFASSDEPKTGASVPFYLQRTLGGSETLRGYPSFRFRDSNLLYFSAEYRWEAAAAVEFAFFYDTGRVFPEGESFSPRHMKKSLGGGFRFKRARRVLLRLDIGHSEEATLVHFRFGPSF